ncbi:MAG: PEGA domain-containing protein [Myxococcaceae bacterium]
MTIIARTALVSSVLLASTAFAEGKLVVAAGGECSDTGLLEKARAFRSVLASRERDRVMDETAVAARLGPGPSATLEELQRRVESAREAFYRNEYWPADANLNAALGEIRLLPLGVERWNLEVGALLVRSLALRKLGRAEDAADAQRAILRLAPDFQLDPFYYAPSVRAEFNRLRKQMAAKKRTSLVVTSTPSGAAVFVDGLRLGTTPSSLSLVEGAYQVEVSRDGVASLPRTVRMPGPETVHVDLDFEGQLRSRTLPCLAGASDEATRLPLAVKLAAAIGANEAIVVMSGGAGVGQHPWVGATLVNATSGEKPREGGVLLGGDPERALVTLARYVLTGDDSGEILPLASLQGPAARHAPPEAAPPPTVSGADPEAVAPEAPAGSSSPAWRTGSYVAFGTAAAALAAAGVVRVVTQNELDAIADGSRTKSLSQDEAAAAKGMVAGRTLALNTLLVGAGAAAVGGATLFLLSRSEDQVGASAFLTPAGPGVLVRGRF